VAKSLAVAGESEQARMLAQEAVQAAQGVSDRWQQPGALAAAAAALVAVGGLDQAEEAIRGIADPDRQQEALAALVERIAEAGHRKRAAALAHRITSPGQQATALAAAGELDSAEEVARRVTDPAERAISLMSVALAAGPERAHSLSAAAVTEALAVCRWTQLLGYLSKLQPAVLSAIASEYLRQRPQRSPVGESA
jgi:hypothetical protein